MSNLSQALQKSLEEFDKFWWNEQPAATKDGEYKACKNFLTSSHNSILRAMIEDLEGEFEQLHRLKKSWDRVEEDGNPNDATKTQIFGFNQAYEIANQALSTIISYIQSILDNKKEI